MGRLRIIGAVIAVLAFAVPVAAAAPRSPLPGWLEQMIGAAPPAVQREMREPQMLQMMLEPTMEEQMRTPDAQQRMKEMMGDAAMQQMMGDAGTMHPGGSIQGMMGSH